MCPASTVAHGEQRRSSLAERIAERAGVTAISEFAEKQRSESAVYWGCFTYELLGQGCVVCSLISLRCAVSL